MRFFVGLTALLLLVHGLSQVRGASMCDTSILQGRTAPVSLMGETYLEPDYLVRIEYHDDHQKDSPVIIYFGNGEGGDDCYALNKVALEEDEEDESVVKSVGFQLTMVGSSKKVGTGFCIYDNKVLDECQYVFAVPRYTGELVIRATIHVTNRRFTGYTGVAGEAGKIISVEDVKLHRM